MQNYSWPGNVRELQNVVERAAILADGGQISTDHLPINQQTAPKNQVALPEDDASFDEEMENFERRLIYAYEKSNRVKARTAKMLASTATGCAIN